jgi:hypothetical protein
VDASAMQAAATRTGHRRHAAKTAAPRIAHSARARNSEAKTLRQRLVVQGPVATSRAMRPPLLQQIAAQATRSAPRRVVAAGGGAGSRDAVMRPRHASSDGQAAPAIGPRTGPICRTGPILTARPPGRYTWAVGSSRMRGIGWSCRVLGDARRLTRCLGVLLLLATTGCVSTPIIGPALLLARADRQAKEGAWEEAVSSYEQYLARFPDSSAAPRALESRDTLTAMLSAQAELTRQREEVTRLRDELAALKDEGTRLREGGTRLRAESTVLRAEVIRLRDERTQLRDETKHLRQELTRRQDDLARTRQELAAQQAEAERLRADIERLKQIDLKLERKR